MGLFSEWAWCWPVNRRILYNRASVDPQGRPWSSKKAILRWTEDNRWLGDVPDGPWPPLSVAGKGKLPFIMKPDGVASIFGPGLADGPFPEHYEPWETPVDKNLFSAQLSSPVAGGFSSKADASGSGDSRFPIVATSHRISEHWQTGVMSRWLPWLLESQPELFVEISEELAKIRGIKNGERCIISSARGSVEAAALVTYRIQPFTVHGRTVHQVSIPFHYGWLQPQNSGDSANLLTSCACDPNTRIPETKSFMVNIIKKGRS
jgi:formate dehydrogenase major subunit